MIEVASGLIKLTLPAFVWKQPLGLPATFGREKYGMAGPLLVVAPFDGIAAADRQLGGDKLVALDHHVVRRLPEGRKGNERQQGGRSFQDKPSGKQ